MSAPVVVDGVACTPDMDWRALTATHLGGPPVWSQRDDRSPLDGLCRVWRALSERAPDALGALGPAVAETCWSSPLGIAVAARFFSNFAGAPGAADFRSALVARWPQIPEPYGNPLPGGMGRTLRAELLRCALQSSPTGVPMDASLNELVRAEALASGAVAEAVLAPLAARDPVWVEQNAVAVLRAHPEAGYAICLAFEFGGQTPEQAVVWVLSHATVVRHSDFAWYIRRVIPEGARAELLARLAAMGDLPVDSHAP